MTNPFRAVVKAMVLAVLRASRRLSRLPSPEEILERYLLTGGRGDALREAVFFVIVFQTCVAFWIVPILLGTIFYILTATVSFGWKAAVPAVEFVLFVAFLFYVADVLDEIDRDGTDGESR